MRLVLFGVLLFLLGRGSRKCAFKQRSEVDQHSEPSPPLTSEFVALVEAKVKEHYTYVLDCYDVAKKEGQNVLQWLFGAIVGGLGLVGSFAKAEYWPLAFGAFCAVCWAAHQAAYLINSLNSQEISPPGNSSETFKSMRDNGVSALSMRWREARGLTLRTNANNYKVELVTKGIDKARIGMTYIPVWFLGSSAIAWLLEWAYRDGYLATFLKALLDVWRI